MRIDGRAGRRRGPPRLPLRRAQGAPRARAARRADLHGWRPADRAVTHGFDLARWAPTVTERVVAVDALGQHCKIDADEVRPLRNRHLGAWRGGVVAEVLALMDAGAESLFRPERIAAEVRTELAARAAMTGR